MTQPKKTNQKKITVKGMSVNISADSASPLAAYRFIPLTQGERTMKKLICVLILFCAGCMTETAQRNIKDGALDGMIRDVEMNQMRMEMDMLRTEIDLGLR